MANAFAAYSTDGASGPPIIISGLYTPTLTDVANITSSSIPYDGDFQWLRISNVVTVSGIVNVEPTVITTTTQLDLTLPVATTIGASQDGRLSGTGVTAIVSGSVAGIRIYGANDQARIDFISISTTAFDISIHFTYRIV
jgi:hypothetical protein